MKRNTHTQISEACILIIIQFIVIVKKKIKNNFKYSFNICICTLNLLQKQSKKLDLAIMN